MDKIKKEVNDMNKQLIDNITKFYNQSTRILNSSYLTGKKEAYEEVIQWLISSHNNEMKFVSNPSALFNFLQEKNAKTKIAILNSTNNNYEDDFIQKLQNENKKKLHRMYNNSMLIPTSESNYDQNVNTFIPFNIANLINQSGNNEVNTNDNGTLNNNDINGNYNMLPNGDVNMSQGNMNNGINLYSYGHNGLKKRDRIFFSGS